MNKKSAGIVLAMAAAVLFSTASLADVPTKAQPIDNTIRCMKTTGHCGSPNGCATMTRIPVTSVQDCYDKGGEDKS